MTLQIRCAGTFWQRLRGVRALDDWASGHWALLLPCCRAVHTLGLEQPIDVLFVTATGQVLRSVPSLPPYRWAACAAAWGVLELPPGYWSSAGGSAGVSAAWRVWKMDA